MTPEGKLKKEVKAYLDSLGPRCWYYPPVPMGYGRRGVPDFLICYRGFFIGAETKRAGGKSQPWQMREQEAIRTAGGKAGQLSDLRYLKMQVEAIDHFWAQYDHYKNTTFR